MAESPVIRSININVREVFEGEDLSWPYRFANSLKVNTREQVIKNQLLFNEGEVYDDFTIAESERAVRRLGFVRQVTIFPTFDNGFVDILVSVQDTWTVLPQLNFSSGGGRERTEVGIRETNLFGYGKRVEIFHADDDGRKSLETVWADPQVFGSDLNLVLAHFDRSDGFRSVGSLSRPFLSLLELDSWSTETELYDLVSSLFEDGDESFVYRTKREKFSASYSVSVGDPEIQIERYGFGYDYVRDRFKLATAEDFDDVNIDPSTVSLNTSMLAENETFSGPFFSLQNVEPNYISRLYIDKFDFQEDFNLGLETEFKLTYAPEVFGSTRDTVIAALSNRFGFEVSDQAFYRFEIGATSRADSEGFNNVLANFDARFYRVFGPQFYKDTFLGRHTFASSFSLSLGKDLDRDFQFLTGGTSGLRGYEEAAFTGDTRLLLNIEQRVHLVEDLYQLVSVGMAVFAEAGGVEDTPQALFKRGIYSDVGIGLRLGFPRSSGGSVLRLDLAFPLRDGDDGTEKFSPQIVITSGQAITARLPSERSGVQNTSTSLAFGR